VPRLGGQSRDYLLRALQEYRDDRRQSGFMEPVAVALQKASLEELASYYATLAEPARKNNAAGDVQLGQVLAERGDPQRDLPPCLACHGEPKRADVPNLAGQSAEYLQQQLQLWRSGGRGETPHGRLMATVARRLSPIQIDAVAAYFASTRAPAGALAGREEAP
jgi:cytochrome c553